MNQAILYCIVIIQIDKTSNNFVGIIDVSHNIELGFEHFVNLFNSKPLTIDSDKIQFPNLLSYAKFVT